jgi:rare lipoprotein A
MDAAAAMAPERISPRFRGWYSALFLILALAGCAGGGKPQPATGEGGHYKLGRAYEINGRWYQPYYDPEYEARGVASWYGDPFHGRKTANGERFDKRRLSAAHTTLPLPSLVEVTNVENGRSLVLRVNDRGPFVGDRLIDLSEAAAEELGFKHSGLAEVEVRFLRLADAAGEPPRPARSAPEPSALRTVSTPAPEPVRDHPVEPRLVAESCELWYVQAGAFRNRESARNVAARMEGLFERSVAGHSVREGGLTRVRVGPFDGRDAAHRALATVAREGYRDAFLLEVQEPASRCAPRSA